MTTPSLLLPLGFPLAPPRGRGAEDIVPHDGAARHVQHLRLERHEREVDRRGGDPKRPTPFQRWKRVASHLRGVLVGSPGEGHAPAEERRNHHRAEHGLVQEHLPHERGEVRGESRARGGGKLRRQRGVPEVLSGAVKHEVVRHLSRRAHEVVPRNGRVAGGRLRGGLLLRVVGGRLRESRLLRRVPRDGLREHVAHDAQAGAGVGRLEDGGALRRPGGRRGAFERHRAAPGAGEVRGAALAIAGPAGGDRPAGGERLETHREARASRCYRSRMFKPLASSWSSAEKTTISPSPDQGFSRGVWHSEVSSTWHFREFFVFPYGIAVSSSRPEKARRQAL